MTYEYPIYVFSSAYEKSIHLIHMAEARYEVACERDGEDEELLEKFEAAKAAHRAQFGALRAYRDEFGQKNWI